MDKIECSLVNQFETSKEQCQFVKDNKICLEDSSFIDYVDLLYCKLSNNIGGSIILFLLLFALFIALRIANQFLCPNLLSVAKVFRMSDSLAGVTLLAFGNGCPEIFSSLAAAAADRPDMIIGELLGGGIFCTSIVSGAIFIGHDFKLACRPMLRDSIFYMIATYCVWLTCYHGEVKFIHAMAFILLYIVYLSTALIGQAIFKRQLQVKYREEAGRRAAIINNVAMRRSLTLDDDNNDGVVRMGKKLAHSDECLKAKEIFTTGESTNELNGLQILPNPTSRPGQTIHPSGFETICCSTLEMDRRLCLKQQEDDPKGNDKIRASVVQEEFQEEISEFSDLLNNLLPINIEKWSENGLAKKIYKLIRAPINLIMIISIPVVDYEANRDRWCRLLNSVHCISVPLTTTLLTSTHHIPTIMGIPLYIMTIIVGFILSLVVFNTSYQNRPPRYHLLYAYAGFIMSIIWVYHIATEIVGLLKTVGLMFSLSDTVIGLGILAWGNSLGDLFANLTLARSGHARLALGACIGAPLLNLLLGFGLSFGLYLGPGGSVDVTYTPKLTVLHATLCIILLALMVSTTLPPLWSRKIYGYFLVSLYFIYILVEGLI